MNIEQALSIQVQANGFLALLSNQVLKLAGAANHDPVSCGPYRSFQAFREQRIVIIWKLENLISVESDHCFSSEDVGGISDKHSAAHPGPDTASLVRVKRSDSRGNGASREDLARHRKCCSSYRGSRVCRIGVVLSQAGALYGDVQSKSLCIIAVMSHGWRRCNLQCHSRYKSQGKH